MGLDLHYCKSCKDDFERMEMGYNAHNGDCGRWQCHLFDTVSFILLLIVMIPLIVIILPIGIFLRVIDYIGGEESAIQEQRDEETIQKRVGRKKQR